MKLASLDNGTKDGSLLLVSRDIKTCIDASDIVPTMQMAIDNWDRVKPYLEDRFQSLINGKSSSIHPFDEKTMDNPLPRAYEWIIGSAYLPYWRRVYESEGREFPEALNRDPLLYQASSATFVPPRKEISHFSERFGLDFEVGLAAVTNDLPMGWNREKDVEPIRLLMLYNHVSLRNNRVLGSDLVGLNTLGNKAFGSFAPCAVTPDELSGAYVDGYVRYPISIKHNKTQMGLLNAGEANFSFLDLIETITATRPLSSGTLVGTGPISVEDHTHGFSSIYERRLMEVQETGYATTPYLKFGDMIEVEVRDADDLRVFGKIEQCILKALEPGAAGETAPVVIPHSMPAIHH